MKRFALLIALGFVTGCTFEASDPSEEYGGEEDIGFAMSAIDTENSLLPNGMVPNGMVPNGLLVASLTPGAVTPLNMAALRTVGTGGDHDRRLMKYIVGCSLCSGQDFAFTYEDNGTQTVTLSGALCIAPEWVTGAISAAKASLVSSCVASRVNRDGISVQISVRSPDPVVASTTGEKSAYSNMEGAFFGDLFSAPPVVKSCYNTAKVAYARSKLRSCAAGSDPDGNPCGTVQIVGPCSTYCTLAADPEDGYESCTYDSITYSKPLTVFLN